MTVGLRSPRYVVASGRARREFSFWTPETAPPTAQPLAVFGTGKSATVKQRSDPLPPEGRSLAWHEAVTSSPDATTKTPVVPARWYAGGSRSAEVKPVAYADPVYVQLEEVPSEDSSPDLSLDAPQPSEPSPSGPSPQQDEVLAAEGQSAFEESCTACHEAQRALAKREIFAGWLATVRRMAAKDDADISRGDFRAIATYLASLGQGADSAAVGRDATLDRPWTFSATVSPVWRGTSDAQVLENPGFFPDVWVGVDWQSRAPFRGNVTVCTGCHGAGGFTFELVEGSATLDLIQMFFGLSDDDPEQCEPILSANVKAGRFVVPFGAFAARSHPGSLRTVTSPLMFNMGRRVGPIAPRQPVLPGPTRTRA